MSRQYAAELFLGQKVVVHITPTAHPIEALVTKIDNQTGTIHVNPIGYKVRWQANPRAISNMAGQFLRFEKDHFFFSDTRSLH
ncbi:MAG: hypothetical protein KC496_06835 [Anaerolineae bacterium]|nr:hypothetical protein [Anaerolineae bacterium]